MLQEYLCYVEPPTEPANISKKCNWFHSTPQTEINPKRKGPKIDLIDHIELLPN